MKNVFILFVFCLGNFTGMAQACRYLDEIFPSVRVTEDIVYARNATILTLIPLGEFAPQPILLDFYEPEGDTLKNRPLIIYFHSGNFLPHPQNRDVVGTRRDSTVVEMCKKLARCGYVVASADYRLGWNPVAPTDIERRIGIINAAYRGVQDANTCIRFFKKTFVEDENVYGIDTARIALYGDDTGGYLSVHASALDRFSKILEDPQFYVPTPPNGDLVPMMAEYLNGDVEAKQYGVNTPPYPLYPFPPGDTLCYAQYTAYSSDFRVAVNMAGAVVDTAWIEPGQPPIISIHTPYDHSTPYTCDDVSIPQIGPVIHVCGSYAIATKCTAIGTNGWFKIDPDTYQYPFHEEVAAVADSHNDGLQGLFPIFGDTITDINPWVFWDRGNMPPIPDSLAIRDNPNMSREKAITYMDSILAYVLPRMYIAMGLNAEPCFLLDNKDFLVEDILIELVPNPTSSILRIRTPGDYVIRGIRIADMQGRLMREVQVVDQNEYSLSVDQLLPGMYILMLHLDQGIVARQFLHH